MKHKIIFNIVKNTFQKPIRTREELEVHQEKNIRKHLGFLKERSFYFKNLLYKNLSDIPVMNKQIMMENFDDLNTVGIKKAEAMALAIEAERTRDFTPQIKGVTIGLSSGTSGNRGLFLASETDRVKYVEVIYDKIIRPLSFKRRKVALFFRANSKLYESVGSFILNFKFFDLTQDLPKQFDALQKYQPDILVAPPTLLSLLMEQDIPIQPERIFSVAEVLEEDLKLKLEKKYNQILHQLYQCTEGFLASTCPYGKLHLHEKYIKFEKKWIDKKTKRFYPIITDFTRRAQPIVRYELNDILQEDDPCPCGSICTTIKKIEGRSDDIFRLEGENEDVIIFPDEIRNAIIIAAPKIDNYKVRQIGKNSITFALKVNPADKAGETEKVIRALKKLVQSKGISKISLTPTNWTTLPPFQKQRRIVNEVKNNV